MTLKELITTLDFNDTQVKSFGLYTRDSNLITKNSNEATPSDLLNYADSKVLRWNAAIYDAALSQEGLYGKRFVRLIITLDL